MESPPFPMIRPALLGPGARRAIEKEPRSDKKCARCRGMRLKCRPVERAWPGLKCQRCEKAREPCGPNLSRKDEVRTGVQIPSRASATTARSSSVLPGDSGASRARESTIPEDRMDTVDSGSSSEGMSSVDWIETTLFKAFSKKHLGDDVDKWLLKLGYLLMYLQYIISTGGSSSVEAVWESTSLYAVHVVMKKTIEELEFTIPKLAKFGEAAAEKGENIQAYRIFGSLLKAVSCSADLSVRIRCSALTKMASFYRKVEDIPQLQEVLEILSPLSTSNNQDLRINPHEMLARSYLTTSMQMSTTFRRVVPSNGPPVHSPALHQSIRCANNEVFRLVLQAITQNRRGYPSLAGSPNESLDPNKDLEGRDTLGRTPLCLACHLGDEGKCEALICAGARVNEIDCDGQTILTVAAGQGLLKTVESLVLHQAEVNPVLLVRKGSTPLQAAAEGGHLEVVKVLLSYGANVHTQRFLDNKTAKQLAQDRGHEIVVKELDEWGTGKRPQATTHDEIVPPIMPGALREDHRNLEPAQPANRFRIMQRMDDMMAVSGSQEFGMTPRDAFSQDGQSMDDFDLGPIENWDQIFPSFDPSLPIPDLGQDMDI